MATLILAKEVLGPVKRYIEIGQFDPGAVWWKVWGRWTLPYLPLRLTPTTHTPPKPHTARTNIKFVVNQFRIKKAMERAVLLAFEQANADPSKLDDAAEVRGWHAWTLGPVKLKLTRLIINVTYT